MDKTGEEILDKTDLKTLWSETLLELLQEAIESQWSSNALLEIVRELQRKNYSGDRLVKIIKKKYGAETADRFRSTLKANSGSGA